MPEARSPQPPTPEFLNRLLFELTGAHVQYLRVLQGLSALMQRLSELTTMEDLPERLAQANPRDDSFYHQFHAGGWTTEFRLFAGELYLELGQSRPDYDPALTDQLRTVLNWPTPTSPAGPIPSLDRAEATRPADVIWVPLT